MLKSEHKILLKYWFFYELFFLGLCLLLVFFIVVVGDAKFGWKGPALCMVGFQIPIIVLLLKAKSRF